LVERRTRGGGYTGCHGNECLKKYRFSGILVLFSKLFAAKMAVSLKEKKLE
jgi:hypothetical protein